MISIIYLYLFIGVILHGGALVYGYFCDREKFDDFSREVSEWTYYEQLTTVCKLILRWPEAVILIIRYKRGS